MTRDPAPSPDGLPPAEALPSGDALPPTELLLVQGGDARLGLDPRTGANRYGCSPRPDPALGDFASSTASVVSEAGFASADRLRERLAVAGGVPLDLLYASELGRLRGELLGLCGLAAPTAIRSKTFSSTRLETSSSTPGQALQGLPSYGARSSPRRTPGSTVPDASGFRPPGPFGSSDGCEVIFAASGSDLHLISAQLVGGTAAKPALAVIVNGEETGSSVPAALAGQAFSGRAALGDCLTEGASLGGAVTEVAQVALRLPDGSPRPLSEVDRDVERLVEGALAKGRPVLLVLADVSKTGLLAPSLGCALALGERPGVQVLVDACQFRLAATTLQAYVRRGFWVALTGSKFLGGPAFSGALLVPGAQAERLRERPMGAALAAFSARADWPATWPQPDLRPAANVGLLLRWQAAIEELRAFRALPDDAVERFLTRFAAAVSTRLEQDPAFEAIAGRPLDRKPLGAPASWDRVQTIFPFRLLRSESAARRTPLGRDETAAIYRALQESLSYELAPVWAAQRFLLGQPVASGQSEGIETTALRLCASARLVVEAVGEGRADAVIARAMSALDKAAWLARTLYSPSPCLPSPPSAS